MKKYIAILTVLMVLASASFIYAAGVATATTERVNVVNQLSRLILTITWVDDNAGTTFSIVPATYGITGWYLYQVETDPSAVTAPTDLYDIVITDANGVDVMAANLMNRSTSTTQLVNAGASAYGYPVIRNTWTFTLSGNAVVGGTGICVLTFIAN